MNKKSFMGLIISIYIFFNCFVIYLLPSTFFKLITWIGNEEITVI